MAARSLSPKQIQERLQQHRSTVAILARQSAKRAVSYRQREYLTETEVDRLIEAARNVGAMAPVTLQRSSWLIVMACVQPNSAHCVGRRLISNMDAACQSSQGWR
jgi:hypothetical protein